MKNTLAVSIFILYSISLFSNGGPIKEGSFTKGSSSIALLNEKYFNLKSEHLYLHIEENYVTIKAVYSIQNSDGGKELKYGFAVDYRDNQGHDGFYWEDDYVKDFRIFSGSEELRYSIRDEKDIRIEKSNFSKYDGAPFDDTISRKWFISSLKFKPNETKELTVSYRLKSNYADWIQHSNVSYYFPDRMSDRMFRYYLKPSGFWGDGKVDFFRLTLTFDDILKYGKINIDGLGGFNGFEKVNNSFVFETDNFDLLNSDYLKIDYNYSRWFATKEAISLNNSKNLVKNIRCSSQNANYPVSNLIDEYIVIIRL